MTSIKDKKYIKKCLIEQLNDFSLKQLTNKEINFFKNKKILITGVSGIIGINLLFFFSKISAKKNLSIKIDGIYNTSLFKFVMRYFKKNRKISFLKKDLANDKINIKKKI